MARNLLQTNFEERPTGHLNRRWLFLYRRSPLWSRRGPSYLLNEQGDLVLDKILSIEMHIVRAAPGDNPPAPSRKLFEILGHLVRGSFEVWHVIVWILRDGIVREDQDRDRIKRAAVKSLIRREIEARRLAV